MTTSLTSSGLPFAACSPVAAIEHAGCSGGRAAEAHDPRASAAPNAHPYLLAGVR